MSEEVTIEPKLILDFIEELGRDTIINMFNLDPEEQLDEEEDKQLQAIANMASLAIVKGLILANNQPGLAAEVVKQMSNESEGYADSLLKEMLSCYHDFTSQ